MRKNLCKKIISLLTAFSTAAAMLVAGTAVQATPDTMRFECEDWQRFGWGDKFTPTTAEGGTQLAMQCWNAEAIAAGQVYVQYNIYVEKDGVYTVKWYGSKAKTGNYVSKYTVAINGTNLDPTETAVDVNYANHTAKATLSAGENTVRFTMNAFRTSDNAQGLIFLDYFELTPDENTIKDGNMLVLEAQNYDSTTHTLTVLQNSTFYGGNWVDTGVIMSGTPTITYTLQADKAGEYEMVVIGSSKKNYYGRFKVTVNGTDVATVEDDNWGFTYIGGPTGATTYIMVRFDPVKVNLNKGINTVVISTDVPGPDNNNRGFALDCIQFTPNIPGGSLKVEGEDMTGVASSNKINATEEFSGGKFARIWKDSTASKVITVPADTFDLYIGAGSAIDTGKFYNCRYLGKMSVKIDDGEEVELNDENTDYIETYGTSSFAGNTAKWKYKTPLTLTAGEHTIAIKCTGAAENGNNMIYLDVVELVPQNAVIGDAEMKLSQNKLAVGETATASAVLNYTNGFECSQSQITGMTFTSSNTSAATIDENGTITARNPGQSTITVTYTTQSGEKSASGVIAVYDESGIVPVSAELANDTVTVKYTRIINGTSSAVVIMGGFDTVNGTDTSLSNVSVNPIDPGRNEVQKVSRAISGENVKVFVWDSISHMKPICEAIELQ